MSLTVRLPETIPGFIDHLDATTSEVEDGHLVLFDNDGAAVARYAPGYWASVSATPPTESS